MFFNVVFHNRFIMPWSIEETERLYVGVLAIGLGDWPFLSSFMSLFRSADSCSNRWSFIVRDPALLNYLAHKYGNYTLESVRMKMAARLNESMHSFFVRGPRTEDTPVNFLMKKAAEEQRRQNVFDPWVWSSLFVDTIILLKWGGYFINLVCLRWVWLWKLATCLYYRFYREHYFTIITGVWMVDFRSS